MDAVSPWVARFAPLVPEGEVLDLACGGGRHARHFAALGHPVLALDRDLSSFPRTREPLRAGGQTAAPPSMTGSAGAPAFAGVTEICAGVTGFEFDLEVPDLVWPFAPGRFGGIVVTNYLHRPLFPLLVQSLRPDGVLIYETFARGNESFGKPSNPAFLLEEGELLRLPLRVIAYESGYTALPKPAMVQRLCACGPAFPSAQANLSSVSGPE